MTADPQVQGPESEVWTRERIEKVWDAFFVEGWELSRPSMYYGEGPDSEFCEDHRRHIVEGVTKADLVPREVAERLAEALATIAADTDPPNGIEDPAKGLAWRVRLAHETEREFRAVYPEKAEEA